MFEYRDIQSLAAYLVKTYPFKVADVIATRNNAKGDESAEQRRKTPATLTPLPRNGLFSNRVAPSLQGRTSARPSEAEVSAEQILERISWQQASVDDTYQTVTL